MSLLPSQVLIIVTVVLFLLYTFRLRTVLRDRVIFVLIVAAGIGLAVHPDFSTRVANAVGIGRGADLLLYVFLLFSLFQNVHLAARLKTLDAQITRIVRHAAIAGAERPRGEGA